MADKGTERRIMAVAQRQAGVWTRAQALQCGLSDGLIRGRRQRGAWASPESGVFVAASSQSSFHAACWVTFLAAGPLAVLSHEAAAVLWRLSVDQPRVVVTMPHGYHPLLRQSLVRQSRDLRASMVRQLVGLPVTSPARTIVDLASSLSVNALGRLLDEATTQRVVRLVEVQSLAQQVVSSGRRGMGRLASVLDERVGSSSPPASELERMFQLLLRSAGLPEGRRHVAIAGRAGRAHIVDSFYEAEMVIVELDGRRWHLRLDKAAEDRARDNHAAALGYLTVRYLWENVVSQPKLAADNLASVLGAWVGNEKLG